MPENPWEGDDFVSLTTSLETTVDVDTRGSPNPELAFLIRYQNRKKIKRFKDLKKLLK